MKIICGGGYSSICTLALKTIQAKIELGWVLGARSRALRGGSGWIGWTLDPPCGSGPYKFPDE